MSTARFIGVLAALLVSVTATTASAADDRIASITGPDRYDRGLVNVPADRDGRAGERPGRTKDSVPPLLPVGPAGVTFVPNVFDADDPVRFITQGTSRPMFITANSLALPLSSGADIPGTDRLVIRFDGANESAAMEPGEPNEARANFFIGSDASRWHTDVPLYESVRISGLYPGIDLDYTGDSEGIKRTYHVSPGADPAQVRLRYNGAQGIRLDGEGGVLVRTHGGTLQQAPPDAYQVVDGKRVTVRASWALDGGDGLAFRVGDYDHSMPLVIDPAITFSTYLGSSDRETGEAIARDGNGYLYVTGDGTSLFPYGPAGFQQNPKGMSGTYVTKMNAAGTKLVYVAVISGGVNVSEPSAIVADSGGHAYVTGYTNTLTPSKADFPTVNAYDNTFNGNFDAFLLKLAPNGNQLVFSTYFGGKDQEFGYDLAPGPNGRIYIAGSTTSTDFPLGVDPYQSKLKGVCDAFLAAFSAGGSFLYSTYLGGSSGDKAYGVATDTKGDVYLTGWTTSNDFPTSSSALFTSPRGGVDAFVAKLNVTKDPASLVYGTYLGGKKTDSGESIAVDKTGRAYIGGDTGSANFPTKNAFDGTYGGGGCPSGWEGDCPLDQDGFISSLAANGDSLGYSTFVGHNAYDTVRDIAVNTAGYAYATGWSTSSKFPTKDKTQQSHAGETDAFLMTVKPNGALDFATLIGGGDYDYGRSVVFDGLGNAFVGGSTKSSDFPTKNAIDATFDHTPPLDYYDVDAFLTEIHIFDVQIDIDNQKKTWLDWFKSIPDWLKDQLKKI